MDHLNVTFMLEGKSYLLDLKEVEAGISDIELQGHFYNVNNLMLLPLTIQAIIAKIGGVGYASSEEFTKALSECEVGVESIKISEVAKKVLVEQAAAAHPLVMDLTDALGDRSIALSTEIHGGLGDVSCMMRVANFLHEECGISAEKIFVSCYRRRLPAYPEVSLFNKHHFPFLTTKEIERRKDLALHVMVPFFITMHTSGHPILRMYEYDRLESGSYEEADGVSQVLAIGLSGKSEGVFIDHELWAFSQSEIANTSIGRISQLRELSPELKLEILGTSDFEDFEAFDRFNRLYYGYCSQDFNFDHFLLAIAEIDKEKGGDKNIVLVTGGNVRSDYLSEIFPSLREAGIATIELINLKDQTVYRLNIAEGGKTIKIYAAALEQKDVRVLLKASEKESIATGDQSLSEAISSDKTFVYEALGHKMELASSINTAFNLKTGQSTKPAMYQIQITADKIKAVFSENLRENRFHLLNQYVAREKDAFYPLAEKISEMLRETNRRK
jgi:hypothetical protein